MAVLEPSEPPEHVTRPGTALLCVDHVGFVRMAPDGELRVIRRKPNRFRDAVEGPDGSELVVAYTRILHVSGDDVSKLGDFRSPGLVDHAAAGPDGTVWATSFVGVHRLDPAEGSRWKTFRKGELGPRISLLSALTVAPDGAVYVAATSSLHTLSADGTWRGVDLGPKRLFLKRLAFDADGRLLVGHGSGVLRRRGERSWDPLRLSRDFPQVSDLHVAADGTLHLQGWREVFVKRPDGTTAEYAPASGLPGRHIETVAGDDRGRTWVATDAGLTVFGPEGRAVQTYPTGSLRALRGAIKRIVVHGSGPELPRPGAAKLGGIQGRILKGRAAVTDAPVEVCRHPNSIHRKSPCSEAPWKQSTQTDASGAFAFEGVPVGVYRFAARVDGTWRLPPAECCAEMVEGEVFDAGDLQLMPER